MQSSIRKGLVAAAVALALGGPGTALAQTDNEKALEARVAELEKLVQQLLAEKQGAAPVAAAPAAPAKAGPPPIQETSVVPNALAGTKFFLTGFAKLDVLYTQTEDGLMASGIGRDFYIPSLTPVGGSDSAAHLQAHVKQTRVMMGTDTVLGDHKLGSRLEFDLYGSALGDERISNTYGLQVRHAYLTYDKWLFGQTWSNFQDVSALPESVDFIGTTDGTVFVRQAQVRWTSGGLSVSAENPNTTLTPFGGGARVVSDENRMPDLTAAYTFKGDRGYLRLGLLGRELRYDTLAASDSTYTVAASLSGKVTFGKDDLRFYLIGGDGMGRYVGLNFVNDAVLDAGGGLEAISGFAGSVAWRHVFTPQWRSNLMFSMQEYDNDVALTGLGTNKSSMSWAVNAIYSPVPKLDLGLEYRYAQRELESGVDGALNRVQATAKYSF